MTNPLSSSAQRTARWCALHPWRAILGWVALVVVAVGLAATVPTVPTTDADLRTGESGRADALVAGAGFVEPDTELVLVRGGDEGERTAAASSLVTGLTDLPSVREVAGPQSGADGSILVTATVGAQEDDAAALQAVTDRVQREFSGLEIRETGDLSLDAAVDERVSEDLASSETLSVPIALVVMLLAFGALIAAGIPVLLASTSVATTVGLLAPLSHLVHLDDTVASIVVLIGMAVGVDYSLFYLKREREERARGLATVDAVEVAARTSGHSILVSAAAVACSMAGLLVMGQATFTSMAVGSILVVAVAALGSVTVLPAVLVALGRWIDRPRVPLLHRLTGRVRRGAVSDRLVGPVVRHPLAALLSAGAVVALLCVPALGMRTHSADLETLPTSIPEVQTMRAVSAAFPSEGVTAELVVRAPASERSAVASALADVETAAEGTALLRASGLPVETSADGRTSVLTLAAPFEASDDRVEAALDRLRGTIAPQALDRIPGAEYAVGGDAAESLDFAHRQQQRLPLVIGLVLLLTLLVMGTTFRSVPLALLSAALNLGSVGAAFGVMTLVFQHGWGAGLLDAQGPGFLIDWVPLVVLVLLVGLSMDYHVFVVSRIHEHVRSGVPTRIAVRRGVTETAGVVTSAAAVMVAVFAIFATLSMLEMKMMGVALSAAVLLDATLVRLVLLPAVLCLLGDRAWWPAPRPTPRGERVVEREPAYAQG
ncbi:MMPL family transporter [Nocardioides flavescens]|uniref:MMPL family transporter n=1 Tax=Nocardioides flavescens TaxID=2691959 RepID=A0A6L7F003_9ACTN|nr:MMPL family transporter [Nocardioides flavescens]MXG87984.1 MMPL family transporter [Nocardioides flavescens]